MYKIGVIGDRESVLGFKAVGLEVFTCDQADEARKILRKIGKEDFAIIYVTEVLAEQISEEIDKYKDVGVKINGEEVSVEIYVCKQYFVLPAITGRTIISKR